MRLLIATRFGLGIEDPAWFEHRLTLLAAITAPSLLAQDDQRFQWVIFTHERVPEQVRAALDHILVPFQGRATVTTDSHSPSTLLALATASGCIDEDDHVLLGRIDDDDAWARGTVAEVRRRVGSWRANRDGAPGIALTFESGLVWIMYDMLDIDQLHKHGRTVMRSAAVRPYSYPFTSISNFVYGPTEAGFTPVSGGHSRIPTLAQELGFTVSVVPTAEPMWLYTRHRQTTSPIHRAADAADLSLSVSDLADRFGINPHAASEYIAHAEDHGYSRILRHFELRGKLRRELLSVRRRLTSADVSASEASDLRRDAARIQAELRDLAENVVAPAPPQRGAP